MSAKDALDRYYRKQAGMVTKPKRAPNKSPEADLEKLLRLQFVALGFSMNKIEAKAVYNHDAGRYVSGQAEAGVADYFGCCPDGMGCFVEVKAPGRRSTLKAHQRLFLVEKISKGCFAVCVDSVELFCKTWAEWDRLRRRYQKHIAIQFLLAELPKDKQPDDGKGLFNEKD